MSDRISANEFRESLDRHLSDMKADPWLAQRIIASENGEIKMKKKRCFGLILAVVLLLALTTVAFAVTRLYRVINWQGDVTRTIDPTQTPASASEDAADMNRLQESLRSFLSEIPDSETACAWYRNDDGTIKCIDSRSTQKKFSSMEEFFEYLSRFQHLTVPASLPKGQVRDFFGNILIECKAFGKYKLITSSQSGSMYYRRFQIDESSEIPTGYEMILSMEDGTIFSISSRPLSGPYEEPISLREGETAQKVSIEGMDALLITAEDPEYPDGLLLQRKLEDPVQLKLLPRHDHMEESDDNSYQYEYITIWAYNLDDPQMLLKFFSAE